MSDVLLVEDEFVVRELVLEVLTESGLEVVAVGTAEAALEALGAGPDAFKVLVTDINLGGPVTGIHIAEQGRTLIPDIKVVYMSGIPSNLYGLADEALMFPKPFDVEDLAARIKLLVGS